MYNKIVSNTELKEIREHGSPHFPFAYYYEDIYDFIDHKIDYH